MECKGSDVIVTLQGATFTDLIGTTVFYRGEPMGRCGVEDVPKPALGESCERLVTAAGHIPGATQVAISKTVLRVTLDDILRYQAQTILTLMELMKAIGKATGVRQASRPKPAHRSSTEQYAHA